MIKFFLTLIVTTAAIVAVALFGIKTKPDFFYQTLILLFVCTAGLYRFLWKTRQQRPEFFVQLYLLTLVIKLLAYGTYMFIVIRNKPEQAAQNVILFMTVYVIFTALEIAFLYRHVSR